MPLRIDHVTIAGSRLEALATAFAAAGLATEYGGMHSNGITHMSLLGFDDGSYVELVSLNRPQERAPNWQAQIVTDGGPCSWAVRVPDVATEVERLRRAAVPVNGPHHSARRRPDQVLVESDMAFVGEHPPGAVHPFVIQDRTARDLRASPSASVRSTEFTGIAKVVIGVDDVERWARELRDAWDLPAPSAITYEPFAGQLLDFPGEPIALAAPGARSPWLAKRLAQYGPSPCAFLVGSRDFEHSMTRYRLRRRGDWGGAPVAWFDDSNMRPRGLGVLGV